MPGHRKPEYQLNSLPITENYDNRLIWQNVPVGKVEPMKVTIMAQQNSCFETVIADMHSIYTNRSRGTLG